ncbi:MAG: DUF3459 domain-containing protein, partial [Vibrio sp.]
IGMTNHKFTQLCDFEDVSAKNLIQKLQKQGQSDTQILNLLNRVSRDHSRTPMQWNHDKLAGFSEQSSWIIVNPNSAQINVEAQKQDPDSVLSFYKKLIGLRKQHLSLITGRYALLLANDPQIYAYQRITETETWTIITNLSAETAEVDNTSFNNLGELVLTNIKDAKPQLESQLAPYAAYVFHVKH